MGRALMGPWANFIFVPWAVYPKQLMSHPHMYTFTGPMNSNIVSLISSCKDACMHACMHAAAAAAAAAVRLHISLQRSHYRNHPEPRLGDPKPRLGDPKPRLGVPKPRLGSQSGSGGKGRNLDKAANEKVSYACIYICGGFSFLSVTNNEGVQQSKIPERTLFSADVRLLVSHSTHVFTCIYIVCA